MGSGIGLKKLVGLYFFIRQSETKVRHFELRAVSKKRLFSAFFYYSRILGGGNNLFELKN
jgi:hypothetical protein